MASDTINKESGNFQNVGISTGLDGKKYVKPSDISQTVHGSYITSKGYRFGLFLSEDTPVETIIAQGSTLDSICDIAQKKQPSLLEHIKDNRSYHEIVRAMLDAAESDVKKEIFGLYAENAKEEKDYKNIEECLKDGSDAIRMEIEIPDLYHCCINVKDYATAIKIIDKFNLGESVKNDLTIIFARDCINKKDLIESDLKLQRDVDLVYNLMKQGPGLSDPEIPEGQGIAIMNYDIHINKATLSQVSSYNIEKAIKIAEEANLPSDYIDKHNDLKDLELPKLLD